MTGFDDISNEILTNENFDRLVKMHVTLDDEHKKAANRRSIESILNGYTNTRTDIADIAVVTNTGEYITSGETRPLVTDNALSYYVVKDSSKAEETHCGLTRIRLRLHPREHIQGTSWSYPT